MNETKKYCRYCSNQVSSKQGQLICSISQNKPSFQDTCINFEFNQNFRNAFARYQLKMSNVELTLWDYFTDILYSHYTVENIENLKISFSILKVRLLQVLVLSLPILLILKSGLELLFNNEALMGSIALVAINSVLLIIMIWAFTISDINKRKNGHVIFGTTNEGCTIEGAIYPWDKVGGMSIYFDKSERDKKIYKLGVYLIGQAEPVSIEINQLNISKKDLIVLVKAIVNKWVILAEH